MSTVPMLIICTACFEREPHVCAMRKAAPVRDPMDVARSALFGVISTELDRAYYKHGKEPWSRHEFYGIIKEEFDELWADICSDAPQEQLLKELVQVAAMCFRYYETGDRNRGEHPKL